MRETRSEKTLNRKVAIPAEREFHSTAYEEQFVKDQSELQTICRPKAICRQIALAKQAYLRSRKTRTVESPRCLSVRLCSSSVFLSESCREYDGKTHKVREGTPPYYASTRVRHRSCRSSFEPCVERLAIQVHSGPRRVFPNTPEATIGLKSFTSSAHCRADSAIPRVNKSLPSQAAFAGGSSN